MNTTNNKLATLLAELDTLESQRRSIWDEYLPIKNRILELIEEKEKLEEQLLSEEQVVDDARFDEIVDGWNKDNIKTPNTDSEEVAELAEFFGEPDGVKTIAENEAIEELQLIDEIKNPDDYVDADLKDLESSQ